jgi:hypothetical protein
MGQVTYNWNAGGQASNVGGGTCVWSASEISGDGVAGYILHLDTAAGDTISTIDRVRIKSAGSTILDLSLTNLISYIQRASRSNFTANVAVDQSLSIPLWVLDGRGSERYASGFPNAQSPTVEVVQNAGATAGTLFLGWRMYDTPFPFYTMATSTATNCPPGSINFRVPINSPGLLRYFGVNTTGLDRIRIIVNGQQLWDLSGDILRESQQLEGLDGATAGDYMTFRLQEMVPVTAGNSYAEFSTSAATWAGVTNEFTTVTMVPQADTLQPKG